MLEADAFHDLQLFIFVYDLIDWETIPLLQSRRPGLNTMRSPGCISASDNFIWLDPVNAVTIDSKAVHQGRKRGAPATIWPFELETIPPPSTRLLMVLLMCLSSGFTPVIKACSTSDRRIATSWIITFCFQPIE